MFSAYSLESRCLVCCSHLRPDLILVTLQGPPIMYLKYNVHYKQ